MPAGHSTTTNPNMRRKGWLLVSEAARKLDMSNQTLYRWLSTKTNPVKGFRDSYRRYVKWSSILEHLGPEACEARELTQQDIWVESGLEEEDNP